MGLRTSLQEPGPKFGRMQLSLAWKIARKGFPWRKLRRSYIHERMIADLDTFYLAQAEPNKSCLLVLRKIILEQDEHVHETRKYGMPCFCYRKKMFCYLWTDKKTNEPYILFVEGTHLDHPALEQGDRSRMKILRIDPTADLQMDTITSNLKDALDLYRSGKIKV